MRVISLGWGVQSFALAAMSALGELPPVDAAVHADTGHERGETYEFAVAWTPWLEERGVRVETVSAPESTQYIYEKNGQTHIPAFTRHTHPIYHEGKILGYRPGKQAGMYRRSCTQRWKIAPIRRWMQANRNGEHVEQWIGITRDEWTRMRTSDVSYASLEYPFMNMLDPPWSRIKVQQWLKANGLDIPVKSACVFCPYHDEATWHEIWQSSNGNWQRACEMDSLLRKRRIKDGYVGYVHRKRLPLESIDLRDQQDHGQLELWPSEECTGMCFL